MHSAEVPFRVRVVNLLTSVLDAQREGLPSIDLESLTVCYDNNVFRDLQVHCGIVDRVYLEETSYHKMCLTEIVCLLNKHV